MRINLSQVILLLAIIILQCTCSISRKHYINNLLKDPTIMNGDISPIILNGEIPVTSILNVASPTNYVLIDLAGQIHTFKIADNKIVTQKNGNCALNRPCNEYFSSCSSHFVWGFGVRDFHVVDLNSHQSKSIVVSHDGNEKIVSANLFSNSLFFIQNYHTGWSLKESYIEVSHFDFDSNKITFSLKCNGGVFFPINNSDAIWEGFGDTTEPSTWELTDFKLQNPLKNSFTDTLTKLDIYVGDDSWNPLSRIMVGRDRKAFNRDFYTYSISWDSSFKDISISPLTYQIPKDKCFSDYFQFSLDGKWARVTASQAPTIDEDNSNQKFNVFYNIDEKYPQKISLPVFGGKTSENSKGAFIDTPEYGTVYLDISDGLNGIIYMYKMSDVLTQIVKKSAEMVK